MANHIYYALIPHPERATILLYQAQPDIWTLPHAAGVDGDYRNVAALQQALIDQLGASATVVRRLKRVVDSETRSSEVVFLVDLHTALTEHTPICWAEPQDLGQIASPLVRETAAEWFQADEPVPPDRPAWALPGWFKQIAGWITEQAHRAGYTPTGMLEQDRTWSLTAMLIQPTSAGKLYIKATNSMFGPEQDVTILLADRFPRHIPAVVAKDADQRLLMTQDFQGTRLNGDPDPSHWELAVDTYAGIQRAMEPDIDALLTLGCWDRRPECLAQRVDELIADTEPMLLGDPRRGMTPEELAQLQVLRPRLKEVCTQIQQYNIPMTLVHGDFHGNNIAMAAEGPVFFDWSDTSVGHPFIDLVSLLEEGDMLPDVPGLPVRLAERYLAHWADVESEERRREAYALARPLAMLNLAVSYRHIYYHTEAAARDELAGALTYWLAKLIQEMK